MLAVSNHSTFVRASNFARQRRKPVLFPVEQPPSSSLIVAVVISEDEEMVETLVFDVLAEKQTFLISAVPVFPIVPPAEFVSVKLRWALVCCHGAADRT